MADKLTIKQEKYCQGLFAGLSQREAYALKLKALRKMGEILGIFGKRRGTETIGDPQTIYFIAEYYFYHTRGFVQKYALACLLDYYMPTWREIVGIENLGGIVERNSKEVREWRKRVFKRDKYKCVYCGNNEDIEAHHLIAWAEFEDTRTDVDNGVTLCNKCHSEQHEGLENFILSRIKCAS